ncbi:4'-phosphopantetheinyl transferase [Kitasatospora sp. DSM 101779]|uniref:4'-phosphopantetheinyl transferase n=1 Tax=Kitasatospora sp. 152608 TaxID=1769566 RepID=A0A0U3A125_9ACTN|nr:4'-phosphopantetheinyl transferase superfamily protein [Kitasatospora sp. DSM 101779]ALT05960.1 4'-phosphopantetheinyl transferase [Kitasatospora sp. 152608]MCU7825054.1 4'-phosphopantetheinyl transferase superfamily protein [Kitasatospora sp. DSM 101779]
MIEQLLAPPVVAVQAFTDPVDPPVLFAEEQALITRAVDSRRREFGTVRACARTALSALGVAPVPILPGPRGAPAWPDGVVGSMTHCAGYRAAAVARAADLVTIGLDAEPHRPLPGSELDVIALPEERTRLSDLAARRPGTCWDRLLFSAKESVYKAWFPLTNRWLDFEEASITFDPDAGTFRARLLVPGPVVAGVRVPGFDGRWLVRNGLALTAITVATGGTAEI